MLFTKIMIVAAMGVSGAAMASVGGLYQSDGFVVEHQGLLSLAISSGEGAAASDGAASPGKVDIPALLGLHASDFPYIYFERDKVLLSGIDFEATLKIAELELSKGGGTSVISVWTIRDQIIPARIAAQISDLYFRYIDGVGLSTGKQAYGRDFAVWHFAWTIGNIYRLGGDDVKEALELAYDDALSRPKALNTPYDVILQEHLMGEQIYMGDAHDAGRAYAQAHVVIPGNPLYLQSFGDFKLQ